MNYIKKILLILNFEERKKIIYSVIFSIIKSLFEIATIGLIIPIISFFLEDKNKISLFIMDISFINSLGKKEILAYLIFIFLIVYLLKTLFLLFYNSWTSNFINNLSIDLINRVSKKYLDKNYLFFLQNNTAFIVRNILNETSVFSLSVVGGFIGFVTSFFVAISLNILFLIFNIYAGFVLLIVVSIGFIFLNITKRLSSKFGIIRQESSALLLKNINELIGKIKEIILYDKKKILLEDIKENGMKFYKSNRYRDTTTAYTGPIIEFISIFIILIFFLYLNIFTNIEQSKIAVILGVFIFTLMRLLPTIIAMFRYLQILKFNAPVIDIIYNILLDNNEIKSGEKIIQEKFQDNLDIHSDKIDIKKIKFKNVNFYYNNSKLPALKNLNFEINAGDKIALIGSTGSGKTTLLNILTTLIEPSSGSININDQEISKITREYRNSLSYVPQSVYLSDSSVISNVTLKKNFSYADKIKTVSVLKNLGLKFINETPILNIKTVGERGTKLSGGQIQRIGLARAIFRNPSILILDKSTAALDKETEEQALNYIFKEFHNKIIVLSTHKKELLKYCNKIIEVKNNEIIINSNIINKDN